MAGQLIAGLAILVTLHELGHFLAARAFGIKVEKFYLKGIICLQRAIGFI